MTRRVRIPWRLGLAVAALSLAVFVSTYWYTFTINLTGSLPGTFYVIHRGEDVGRRDLVAFRWHGSKGYPAGSIFIKQVAGVAGDVVRRDGRAFWVNGQYIGIAKENARDGSRLEAADDGVIGAGQYFVATPNPDSLDSRYALTGNIRQAAVLGRAYEIF